MMYRTLGRTGIKVSAISLGCEGFAGKTPAEAREMMDFSIANGINFIDIYASDPELRSIIGNAVAGRYDRFHVQGHIGSVWKNGQYERTRNVAESRAAFDDLLARLGTDYIDVGMIHYSDQEDDFYAIFDGPFIEFALELKAAGKIRSVGLSSHNPVVAKMAVETGLVDVLMFSVNPCYDMQPPDEDVENLWSDEVYKKSFHNFNSEREALYGLCARHGIGIDVMKVYAGGDLLKADQSMFGRAMSPVQALNYALTRPAVAAVMAGCRNIAEIEAALAWCAASDAEKDYSTVLTGLERCSWSGHCMYCGHCAPCPKAISIADVNKYLNLALAQDEIPETVREHYRLLPHHASECIRCGACEQRCPFQVKIRERMKMAQQVFHL
ncbi:MAG: 4Fe-4S binding protein [Lentisphaeria bacterium]|nr:4Fe-4S binding protein [Lentisphaeria bacterium]